MSFQFINHKTQNSNQDSDINVLKSKHEQKLTKIIF